MNYFKKMSFKAKLTMGALLFGMIPMIGSQLLGMKFSVENLDEINEGVIKSRVEGKAQEFKNLYSQFGKEIRSLADSEMTTDAFLDFENSFFQIDKEISSQVPESKRNEGLRKIYETEFGNRFKEFNPKINSISFNEFQSSLNSNSLFAQYAYTASNENKLGEKDKAQKSNFNLTYDKFHEKYHHSFRTYLTEYRYYDVFLIDLKGNIVYSVFKELDFATNLLNGKGTQFALAQAYRKALDLKQGEAPFIFTDFAPYFYSYNMPASFTAYPLYKDGKMIGVLAMQIDISRINEIFDYGKKWKENNLGETGQVYLVGNDKKLRSEYRDYLENSDNFIDHLKKANGLTEESEDFLRNKKTSILGVTLNGNYVDEMFKAKDGNGHILKYENIMGEAKTGHFKKISLSGFDWYVVSSVSDSELMGSIISLEKSIGLQILCTMFLIWFFSALVGKGVAKSFSDITKSLYEKAESVGVASESIKKSSVELSDAGNEQAASLQETVSSVDEISAMVAKNSDAANQSKQMAEESKSAAENGKRTIEQMINSMGEINSSNTEIMTTMEQNNKEINDIVRVIAEIGDKTKVINDIVFQTKLLSFNASVEAARAGEHGKGFAVVAEEVGNLAQMSGKASDEISSMLANSISKVELIAKNTAEKVDKLITKGKERINHGTRVANECGESLNEILTNVVKVNNMINEISTASAEQSQGIHEITKAMASLDHVTQQNAKLASKTSGVSAELHDEYEELVRTIKNLVGLVEGEKKISNSENSNTKLSHSNSKSTTFERGNENVKSQNTFDSKNSSLKTDNLLSLSSKKQFVDSRSIVEKENKFAQRNSTLVNTDAIKKAVGDGVTESSNYPDKNDPRFEEV